MFMLILSKTVTNLSNMQIGENPTVQVEVLGYAFLAVSVLVVAFSAYRYLLWYTLAGMVYWLLIEVVHAGLIDVFALSSWHGYIIALMSSWMLMVAWLTHRQKYHLTIQHSEQNTGQHNTKHYIAGKHRTNHNTNTPWQAHQQNHRHARQQWTPIIKDNRHTSDVNSVDKLQSKYIEHTPVYKDYQPRFQ